MLQTTKSRLLHDSFRRYLRVQAWEHLDKLIAKTRDEELALVLAGFSEDSQRAVFERLPNSERKANVIVQMEPPFGTRILEPMAPPKAAAILREMATDDATDIIADLSEEQKAAVLEILESSDELEELMQYGGETAGGIMLPDFVALHADNTCEEAIDKLRASSDVEMIYYIYVVDEAGILVGVVSLRKLVAASPATRVREVMEDDVIRVTTSTDQEEVANLAARYGFLAIPVVDDANKLVGLVTIDDVIDVLQDEATEDILKMAGAGTGLEETEGVLRNLRVRFPWLIASSVGGLLAAWVMGSYRETLEAHYYLALFVPVILGLSGNVGTQSATVTVRALAVGLISHSERSWAVVRREFLIGVSFGLIYGTLIGVIAGVFAGSVGYGLVIGVSLATGIMVANTVGTAIPMVLSRLHIDPAVATGPLVTTTVDVLGILTYFTIATLFTAQLQLAI